MDKANQYQNYLTNTKRNKHVTFTPKPFWITCLLRCVLAWYKQWNSTKHVYNSLTKCSENWIANNDILLYIQVPVGVGT